MRHKQSSLGLTVAPASGTVVNVASVPHRSPFRYPGGKTWLVPYVRAWLRSLAPRPTELAEIFAGGAIVGLSALFDRLVASATLIEMDRDVAAVWQVILNGKGKELADRISGFRVSERAVRKVLDAKHRRQIDRAFATIVRNRCQRGGIMAPGASLMRKGENGKGLASRWYADTLRRRILDIVAIKQQIRFTQGDGIAWLARNAARTSVAYFIDPPYTVAGRRLYAHSDIDHERLFRIARTVKGDFLMTYDNAAPIRAMAKDHGFDTQTVSMKNTHHSVMRELLIGRNLDWCRT
jgi:DNA adenine methylase